MSADLSAVVAAIRGNDRFVVVTHENPDGDALGSMLATTLGLRALGKDASMYLTGTAPLPGRVRLPRSRRALCARCPTTSSGACCSRSTVPTSAGSATTRPVARRRAQLVVNVDHHHDNDRFGDVEPDRRPTRRRPPRSCGTSCASSTSR